MSWIVSGIGNKLSDCFEAVTDCCPGAKESSFESKINENEMNTFSDLDDVWEGDDRVAHPVAQVAIEEEKKGKEKPKSLPVLPSSPKVDFVLLEQELRRQRQAQVALPYSLYEQVITGKAQADTVLAQASQLCQQLEGEVDAQRMAVTCCLAAQREIAAMHEKIAEILESESVLEEAFQLGNEHLQKPSVGVSSLTEARFFHEMGKLCSQFKMPKMVDAEKYLNKALGLFRSAEEVDYSSVLEVLILMAENLKAEKDEIRKDGTVTKIQEIISVWFEGVPPEGLESRVNALN